MGTEQSHRSALRVGKRRDIVEDNTLRMEGTSIADDKTLRAETADNDTVRTKYLAGIEQTHRKGLHVSRGEPNEGNANGKENN